MEVYACIFLQTDLTWLYGFQDKVNQMEPKLTNIRNDNYFLILLQIYLHSPPPPSHWSPLKNSCVEYANIFCIALTVSMI